MQYLISDIHGDLNSLKKLLGQLDFNNDKLIILGDVIDKGSEPMESFNMVRTLMKEYPGRVVLRSFFEKYRFVGRV